MADNKKMQEQLKEITDQLEQGIKEVFESGTYQEYLDVMSRFHNYSANNSMLIAMQNPDATFVAGFDAWKTKFGRYVKRGERAISIIAPNPVKIKEEVEKLDPVTREPVLNGLGQPILEEVETTQMTFRVAKVFDVSQTEGRELPDFVMDELTGEVKDFPFFMQVLEEVSPVPIGFEAIDDAYGYYHQIEKRIAIQVGLSEVHTMKTAVHEISHAVLHDIDVNKQDGRGRKDSRSREVEAESVAYTICTHYGLDTSGYSFEYIAGWSSDKDVPELKRSLDTIRKTSAGLITAIDERMKVLIQEKAIARGEPAVIREGTLRDRQNEPQQMPDSASERRMEISGKETSLVYGHDDYFGIYQLKQGEELRDYRFENLAHLQTRGLAVDKANYELVYQGALKNESLDDIFERFNIERPDDFKGHSLSVSDIVVFRREGETQAHYVDRFGFQEVKDFYRQPERESEKTEIAYNLGDKYIAVQTSEDGYDYSLYDQEYVLLDGGLLEAPGITVEAAAKEIVTDLYGDISLEEVNYDALVEWADKRNAIRPEQNKEREVGDAKQSISFYVAENGEFHNAGEYHDNLTIQEAIAIYHTIPSDRMNAGKAIGFELQTGMEGIFSDVSMELFYFNTIGMDSVEHIDSIRGNELIWDAMKELAAAFPDAEIDNRETIERLAADLNELAKEIDPYEYRNSVDDEQEAVKELVDILTKNDPEIEWEGVNELLEEKAADVELFDQAKLLKQRVEDVWLRRERNPLTKVEELEESNYNQIDGTLNNMTSPKEGLKGSIHTRLEQAREILAKAQEAQPIQSASKQRGELEN